MEFRRALGRTIGMMDIPFGYTLTVWGSGSIVLLRYGALRLPYIFLFIAGAVAAYLACAVVAWREAVQVTPRPLRQITLINVSSLFAAGAVALVVRLIAGPMPGSLAAGFVATLSYILLISSLMFLAQWLETRARR